MCSLESLKIDLKSLKQGVNTLCYSLDDAFFEAVASTDITRGEVAVTLTINRVEDIFEVHCHGEGTVIVPCDLCLDDMQQPITVDDEFVVKFGEETSEEDDLVIVAEDEGILDIAWHLYESVALAVPIRHVHEPGKCNPAMIEKLQEHSAARSDEETPEEIDPRWAALKKLKIE